MTTEIIDTSLPRANHTQSESERERGEEEERQGKERRGEEEEEEKGDTLNFSKLPK